MTDAYRVVYVTEIDVIRAAREAEKGLPVMNANDEDLVRGSGNVFRDFDDPEADVEHAKAVLAARIIAALDERRLSTRRAAELTGFAAADFSRIRNADLGRFSLDKLMRVVAALDRRARIAVHIDIPKADPAPV